MEKQWVIDRAKLRQLLHEQPNGSIQQYAQTVGCSRKWGLLFQPLMWTGGVIVLDMFPKYTHEMLLIEDEDLIQPFLTHRADSTFGYGIGFWRLKGRKDDFKAIRDEDWVEAGAELAIAVMHEETQTLDLSLRSQTS